MKNAILVETHGCASLIIKDILRNKIMTTKSLFRDIIMAPLSWIYGLVVGIRNGMFNIGLLKSTKFDIPVIVVGNITAGGTGKTPVTEYLVKLLSEKFRTAVVSRGYKRKTSGYILSTEKSTPDQIGDEPYQIKRKYPNVVLAVDEKRVRAIKKLCDEGSIRPEVFVLDDAYQHRYVTPDISILLVDYNNMIYEDRLLPLGRLREPLKAKDKAQIVIVTKCPKDITPMELRVITMNLSLYPYQTLFFSYMEYGELQPVFPNAKKLSDEHLKESTALSLTGIASPTTFEEYVRSMTAGIKTINFSDHHKLTLKDYNKVSEMFAEIDNNKKIILTTEKDAVKMMNDEAFPSALKEFIYYIPMNIKFLKDEESFNNLIINFVTKNRSMRNTKSMFK